MKNSLVLDSERGASAVLIALSMIVLLGFAAVAIDAAGVGFNERRQDQSASDVGALAAVQFAQPVNMGHPECSGLSGLSLSRCNGAVEARDVANATLDTTSVADWTNASLCSTPPAGYTSVPSVSQCIAFNANNQRAWVRIPTITNDTWIAGAVGINSISATADAIAGAAFANPGGVLPFLLPGNAGASNYNCLKTGPNPTFGACDPLPVTGNFGSGDFFLYGDVTKGWTSRCNGDTNGRLVANIARGVDHPIGIHPTGSGPGTEEQPSCPDFNAEPDMVQGQPGVGSNLETGLVYGGSSYSPAPYDGRIEDSGGVQVRNAGGGTPAVVIDATPLWSYLSTSASLNGTPCDDATVNTPDLMEICIDWAKNDVAGPHVVFNNLLVGGKRFGWVPELYETTFGTPGTTYHISNYRPVYLDSTFYGCSANQCGIMHTPGVPNGGPCVANPADPRTTCGVPGSFGGNGLSAVTAFILSKDIVPDNAKTPSPGSANQRMFDLVD